MTVTPHQTVSLIEFEIVDNSVAQLESFEIDVQTFDAWGNEIPVPPETQVKLTGRMTAKAGENGHWTITTLDDKEQTVTISVHNVEKSDTIMVEGNIMGFFESGGPIYYAGGVLGILVIIVLLVVVVMVLRSGGSEYDDEDDDDYDDDYDESEATQEPGPVGPGPVGPGPGGPPPSAEPQQEDWMSDFRVDEDGTEWAEDKDGIWWYRDAGTTDWNEWAD